MKGPQERSDASWALLYLAWLFHIRSSLLLVQSQIKAYFAGVFVCLLAHFEPFRAKWVLFCFNCRIINDTGLGCMASDDRRPEWYWAHALLFHECVCRSVCVWGVFIMCADDFVRVHVFFWSTLLSWSFTQRESECVREVVCVCTFSAGTISTEGKGTEKLWESFYVLWSETVLRKPFIRPLFIRASTFRRALTQLPSSLPLPFNPSPCLYPILGSASLQLVKASPWAKSMDCMVVEQCGPHQWLCRESAIWNQNVEALF